MPKTFIDDAALHRALTQIAQEETQQLEWEYQQDRLPFPRQAVQEIFDHHRPEALKLIRQKTRRSASLSKGLLPLAACLVLLIAGAYTALRQPPHKDVPIQPLATAVLPITPLSHIPEGWRGHYYPSWLPEGYAFVQLRNESTVQEALYRNEQGDLLIFSEDTQSTHFELQGDETAVFDYKALDDQTVALTALSQEQGCFVVWDVNGQTLIVTMNAPNEAAALAVAQSVEPVKK